MPRKKGHIDKVPTKKDLAFIRSSAKKGWSRAKIRVALDMHQNAFCEKTTRAEIIEDAFQQGLEDLKAEIAKKTIASDDYRHHAMLFSKLSILSEPVQIEDIDSLESLQKAMGATLKAFSEGKINAEQLNAFTKSCSQLSQLYFDQSIQAQLDELKSQLSNKQDKNIKDFE